MLIWMVLRRTQWMMLWWIVVYIFEGTIFWHAKHLSTTHHIFKHTVGAWNKCTHRIVKMTIDGCDSNTTTVKKYTQKKHSLRFSFTTISFKNYNDGWNVWLCVKIYVKVRKWPTSLSDSPFFVIDKWNTSTGYLF